MPGHRRHGPPRRLGLRLMAGAVSVGIVAAAGATILATAGQATAAPTPTPAYHPGSDTATFTATGVLDSNCLISTGGTEVWIKPGDAINFKSALAGINLGSLALTTGQVAGLNVTAAIDATATSPGQNVSVAAGRTTVFPRPGQSALPSGNHRLTWTMKSIALVPGVLGTVLPPVTLTSSSLRSGASLDWSGVIHVTNDAPKCKISVGTPGVAVSVGPIKVTVPPINVGIPTNLPGLPGLPGAGGTTAPGGHQTTPANGFRYTPPPLTVPEQAMGGGGNGGGGFQGVLPNGAGASQIGTNVPSVPVASDGAQASDAAGTARKTVTTIGLSANKAPAAQLPVLLAIIAIIALSLVTAAYARLYLLRRHS